MSKSHLPMSCVTPSIVTTCPPLQSLERVTENVPFRVSARWLYQVARIGFMTLRAESRANFLRFFAGDKYFHCPQSFVKKSPYQPAAFRGSPSAQGGTMLIMRTTLSSAASASCVSGSSMMTSSWTWNTT